MGSVTIGPLCPVEPCVGEVGDAYTGRELTLQQPGGMHFDIPLRPDGSFEDTLPVGTYSAHMGLCDYLGCDRAFPIDVEIKDGETTTLNIDIDTGIRSPVGQSEANLLTVLDVELLLITPSRLGSELIDYKALAGRVDPAQVENMDSWYGLVIDATGGGPGMTFMVIDFVSQSAAQEHYGIMTAEPDGVVNMTTPIGDVSAEVEFNAQGIGSMLVFIKGDKLVSLHTAQPEGEKPLVSLEGLEQLARLVLSRL